MRLVLLVALAAVLNACAADQPCCDSRLSLTPGGRYRTIISNPDGGASTSAELVLTSAPTFDTPGIVTVTFTHGGREVTQRFSATKRY